MSDKPVQVTSSDGTPFLIPRSCIKHSTLLNTIINDLRLDEIEDDKEDSKSIPLPKVNAAILKRIIQWMEHHKDDAPSTDDNEKKLDEIGAWDSAFLKVDQATLFELILAANYMDIKGLLDVACKSVANMIKGKTPDEIRRTFNIKNDFTPDEEQMIRRENAWCED